MEINSQREEYITTIFKLNEREKKATNKRLSEWIDVSRASVTEMLKKLENDGIIDNTKNIKLTDMGNEIAKNILSKHRLWEKFLEVKLGIDWKYVHEYARKLQTVTDDEILNKLNKYLGYPDYCSHGAVIYVNSEESNDSLVKMSEAKVNEEYIIRRISDQNELLEYIDNLELSLGDKIKIKKIEKFDNAIIIIKGEHEVFISPKAAINIYLKAINS